MVSQSNMHLLFFLGILIPALVTVGLFVAFCYCWHRIRVRNEILCKKHDPHKIKLLKEMGKKYEPPLSPPPPFTYEIEPPLPSSPSSFTYDMFLSESLHRNYNNDYKHAENNNYEESPEPTKSLDNPDIYRTNDNLNRIQCNADSGVLHFALNNSNDRPNSQASEDSDDSGFRSSRSGQYPHRASGNARDNYAANALHTLQEQDPIPMLKPIKVHPNENRRKEIVPYIHRNSNKHKDIRERIAIPTSEHYRQWPTQSHYNGVNNINAINSSQQQMFQVQSSGRSCASMQQYVSMSINDVDGGRMHSIDSHIEPLNLAGHYGTRACNDVCHDQRNNSYINKYHSDGLFSESRRTGYDSASGSTNNIGNINSHSQANSIHDNGQTKTSVFYPLSYNSQKTVSGHSRIKSHIPGYSISSSTHIKHIQPDLELYEHDAPLQTIAVSSQQITVRQSIYDKSYIDDLGESSLYSVV